MNKAIKIGWLIFAAAMVSGLVPGSSTAQDPAEIDPIKPVPALETGASAPSSQRGGPCSGEDFYSTGHVNSIRDGEIVIGDRIWKLSPEVAYYKVSTGFSASPGEVASGKYVGFCTDADQVISSLWLIDLQPE